MQAAHRRYVTMQSVFWDILKRTKKLKLSLYNNPTGFQYN